MPTSIRTALWVACILVSIPVSLAAQQGCPAASSLPPASGANIFSPQQEVDLGAVTAERAERTLGVIDDPELVGYLQRLADRIVQQFPSTGLRFQVWLVDLPDANAFSLPGGRIYISRKIISFVRNDDELAGVLAHEMGHILSHQGAVETSRLFHDILGVDSVGDRRDIFEKYNRLLDQWAKNPKEFERLGKREEPNQYQADRVALYALADAGFSPRAFVDLWDRLAETHGKSGGFFSDFFGMTTPGEKRLREIRKSLDALPPACTGKLSSPPSPDFAEWQARVLAYSGLGRREVLTGLVARRELTPPLVSDLVHIRFSPDGRYLLAQDESGIFVLTRDPLRLLFRIDAPNAHPAQFTPDSQGIVFSTLALRVERWSVAEQQRTAIHEMVIRSGCTNSALSPDGNTLACYTLDFTLRLFDVGTGEAWLTKKNFAEPASNTVAILNFFFALLRLESAEFVRFRFSPDGHYLVAAGYQDSLTVDLASRKEIHIPGSLKQAYENGFAFLASDRVVGYAEDDLKHPRLLAFPSGQHLQSGEIPASLQFAGPTRGPYILMPDPIRNQTNVYDLRSSKLTFGTPVSMAADLFDNTFAAQRRNGDLVLIDTQTRRVLASFALPRAPLGALRVADLSPDLTWLVLSERTRGGVWNLDSQERLYSVRGFRGAYLDGERAVFADFPAFGNEKHEIVRMDLVALNPAPALPVVDKNATQVGNHLVVRKPIGKSLLDRGFTLDVLEIPSGKLLWSRAFTKDVPSFFPGNRFFALVWLLDSPPARAAGQADAALAGRIAKVKNKSESYYVEILDAADGAVRSRIVVDTSMASFTMLTAGAAQGWFVFSDNEGRLRFYSLSDGMQKAELFGTHYALSNAAGIALVESKPGVLSLYSTKDFARLAQITLSSEVSLADFDASGRRLLVLTRNQTVYKFDVAEVLKAGVGKE